MKSGSILRLCPRWTIWTQTPWEEELFIAIKQIRSTTNKLTWGWLIYEVKDNCYFFAEQDWARENFVGIT